METTGLLAILKGTFIPAEGDVSAWAATRRAERAAARAAGEPSARHGLRVDDYAVPPDGIPVRAFRRTELQGQPLPVLLWIYGGAFMFGSLDEWEVQYASLARALDAVVVGVDYRKAPDDPFPAG